MTENIFIGIFRLKGHQGMGKTCACFKFKEKVWLWDTLMCTCFGYMPDMGNSKAVDQDPHGSALNFPPGSRRE